MTIQETRQLGIEFERRVQTMIPQRELDKLDTETIYAFLNQYQDKYINTVYRGLDSLQSGTKQAMYVENIINDMLDSDTKQVPTHGNLSFDIALPTNFGVYVRSTSEVTSYYKGSADNRSTTLPNKTVTQSDMQNFEAKPYDSLRILRNPVVTLTKDKKLHVVHDRYTTITKVTTYYYKMPAYFSILDSTACELPAICFDDIVSGAVDLYIQYVAGAEANKRRQEEAERQASRNNKNEEQ